VEVGEMRGEFVLIVENEAEESFELSDCGVRRVMVESILEGLPYGSCAGTVNETDVAAAPKDFCIWD